MQDSKFYGTENISSISYLEFGAIDLDSSKKLVWDLKLHQKAYDWYMHARYSNDILCYMEMGEQIDNLSIVEVISRYCKEVHHKDDFSVNIGKLCALAAARNSAPAGKPLSFFELGQTLFGCIDTMEFCQRMMSHLNIAFPQVDLRAVEWYGVDISDFFNKLSKLMHSGFRMHTYDDMKHLDGQKDVFFAKGVTMLYAIRSMEQFIDMLKSAKICVFDYSFAADREHEIIIGSGKLVKYLRLNNLVQELHKLPGKMYVKKGNSFFDKKNDRVVLDCLYADEQSCKDFISQDSFIRNAFGKCLSGHEGAEIFLDSAAGKNGGWMLLEEFIDTQVYC